MPVLDALPRRRLRVFISSAMQELQSERQIIKATLEREKGQSIDFARLQSAWRLALRDPVMSPAGYAEA